jgi:hypothetical protein
MNDEPPFDDRNLDLYNLYDRRRLSARIGSFTYGLFDRVPTLDPPQPASPVHHPREPTLTPTFSGSLGHFDVVAVRVAEGLVTDEAIEELPERHVGFI